MISTFLQAMMQATRFFRALFLSAAILVVVSAEEEAKKTEEDPAEPAAPAKAPLDATVFKKEAQPLVVVPPPDPGMESHEDEAAKAPVVHRGGNAPTHADSIITNKNASLIRAKVTVDQYQFRLELGRKLRFSKTFDQAEKQFMSLLDDDVPPESQRPALLEMAFLAQDMHEYSKAQQIYSEYLKRYSNDPTVPEVTLRQALLLREMGAYNHAIAKFYAVMSSSLKLNLDQLDYYQGLVLKAQTEIAETYYLQGKYAESAEFFKRLLKLDSSALDKSAVTYKLIRSLSYIPKHDEVVAMSQMFLRLYPDSLDLPEVRFLTADAYKKLGRNRDALQQVLLLLQKQSEKSKSHPDIWSYWQQRTGNEIANQLYREGDYLNALEIYLNLAKINPSPEWQVPVYYQAGLVYEHLKQPDRAMEIYDLIAKSGTGVEAKTAAQSLVTILDMAKWRRQHLSWMQKAEITQKDMIPETLRNAPQPAAN